MLLLRSLRCVFRVPNRILLDVFGDLCMADTERPPELLCGVSLRRSLERSNAENSERIRALILSDDVMIAALVMGRDPVKIMWN